MILTSLKTNVQAMAYPPSFVFTPTLRNYVDVFAKNPFAQYIVNSTLSRSWPSARASSAAYPRPMPWRDVVRDRSAFCS